MRLDDGLLSYGAKENNNLNINLGSPPEPNSLCICPTQVLGTAFFHATIIAAGP